MLLVAEKNSGAQYNRPREPPAPASGLSAVETETGAINSANSLWVAPFFLFLRNFAVWRMKGGVNKGSKKYGNKARASRERERGVKII